MIRQTMSPIPDRSAAPATLVSAYGPLPGLRMTRNLAPWDVAARLVLGSALLYIAWALLTGVPAVVVGAVGAVFLATGVAGVCPLYAITGIVTRPSRHRHP